MSTLFSKEGFQSLRFAWLTLLMGGTVAGGIAWGSYVYNQSEEKSLAGSRQQLSQAETRLALARRERDDLATSSATYRQLSDRGALRPESRLELIERLSTLKSTHKLVKLEYDVEPQRKVTFAGIPAEAIELNASHVRLMLHALHEADVLAFLRDLARPPSGFLPASDCNLRALEDSGGGARVEATCNFEWVSVTSKRGARAS